MANSSFIFCAGDGGNVAKIDANTKAVTYLPANSYGRRIRCIAAQDENNIWVGFQETGLGSYYPIIGYWDGNSWTNYTVTAAPLKALGYFINSLLFLAEDEIYATAAPNLGGTQLLLRWNGLAWSIAQTYARGGPAIIDPNSTTDDIWISNFRNDTNFISGFRGSRRQLPGPVITDFVAGTSNNQSYGIYQNNSGEVFVLNRLTNPERGELYKRNINTGSWDLEVSVSHSVTTTGQNLWIDPFTQDVWLLGFNNVSKWDGITLTTENLPVGSARAINGVSLQVGKVAIWTVNPSINSFASFRDPDTGIWDTVSLTFQPFSLVVFQIQVGVPPTIENRYPSIDAVNVDPFLPITFDTQDVDNDIDPTETLIYINGELAWSGGAPTTGFVGTQTSITNGYSYSIEPDTFLTQGLNTVRVYLNDSLNYELDTEWSFTVSPYPSQEVGNQVQVTYGGKLFTPKPIRYLNDFDEHGSMLSLPRLRKEKNWEYKRRIQDAAVNLANSSYRGLVNGITRELGLSLFDAININPKVDNNGAFLAEDPYIVFSGAWLLLYSNYKKGSLDWAIDRYQTGGNFEHLQRLIETINNTSLFEASLISGVNEYTRSMSILNQSNRAKVKAEFIPQSTKFRLENNYLAKGTVFFSNRRTFNKEKASENLVLNKGDYYIDYQKGIVTVFNMPKPKEYVRYHYNKYPFSAIASPVILNDINSDMFTAKMFNQILQDDGTYKNGLPTELGVDIINELMSVIPLYWGI
jgi:hypothetical protein